MIWNTEFTIEDLNRHQENTLVSHLGIEFIEIGEDYLIGKMPVDHRTKQPYGLLHGGASVAFAESLGSAAAALSCKLGPGTPIVGVSINANHLKTVHQGFVYGKITPVRIGRTIQVWQIIVTNETGDKVCISRLTTMALKT